MEENMAILIPVFLFSRAYSEKQQRMEDTVVTTIDVSLQKIVEDKILAFNQAHAGEARRSREVKIQQS